MTERTIRKKSWTDADSDSISVTSTKESEVDEDATYVVDRILAEEDDDEGKLYLIRWEGYPLLQSTWEPAENIQMHETFDKWEAEKERIKRGDAQPFDILGFNNQLRELINAREARHKRRRAKRKRLGIPVSPSSSDPEDSATVINQVDAESSDEPIEYREEREDHSGLSSPAKRSAQTTRSRQNLEVSQDVSDISEDSLLEELVQKALKRPSLGVLKKTGKQLKRGGDSARVSPTLESPSRRDSSPPSAAGDDEAEKPRRRGEIFSRTGYKGTANRGASTSGIAPRARGGAAARGSTRGSTRGLTRGSALIRGRGATSGSVNFTGIKSTAEGAAKQKRSLSNSILKAPKSSAAGQKDHFKTLSMVRKAELGGRALADRAPDMQFVGPLRTPSEYAGPRPGRNRPQEAMIEGLRKDSKSEQRRTKSSSPMDSNNAQDLLGQNMTDDDDLIVLHEGPGTFVRAVETTRGIDKLGGNLSSSGPESQKQPQMTQLETEPVIAKVHKPSQLSGSSPSNLMGKNTPSTDLPDWTPVGPRAFLQGQGQNVARRNESLRSGLVEKSAEQAPPDISSETPSGPRQPNLTKGNVQNGQRPPSKSVTKMRLSEYTSRRVSDLFGNAISVQAIFGSKSTQPLPIAFAETNKYSDQPWILALRDIKTMFFIKEFIAQDLEPQAKILHSSSLARGSVITDASGTLALKEIAENLRPCLGILFQHSAFNILLFPGRCEEWKFLGIPGADQNAVLRYHVYSQSCAVAINSLSPQVVSINEHLSSLVELSQGLKYTSLVPRCKEGQDLHNFYLLFPRKASDSANLLAAWLRACNGESRIFTNRKPGSWSMFGNRSIVKSGAMIIHTSLVPLVSKIPKIERILSGRSSINFWCFEDGSSESLHSNPSGEGVRIVRLFPHGGAVMLTPSFLLTQPQKTHELLVWFKVKAANATTGTWKLVLPYDCRQLLLDLAIKKRAEGEDANICKFWFLSHQILDNLVQESMEDLPYCWGNDAPDEGECSIVYADQSIKPDDEISLASWYAGWTMLHLDLFRKFIIVGTKPDKNALHTRERKNNTTGSGAGRAEETHPGASVPAKDDTQRGTTSKSSSSKWKRDAFAVVKDPSPNVEQDLFNPAKTAPSKHARTQDLGAYNERKKHGNLTGSSDDTDDMKRISRPSHGIDETLNRSILQFIAITGANREDAERFLNNFDGDVDNAARNYFSSAKLTSTPPSIPQLDGTQDADPTTLLDFHLRSDATNSVAFQSLHLALEDVKRAKELYKAVHDPLRSPSRGPANYDGADENKGLSGKPPTMASGAVTDEMTNRRYVPSSVRSSGSVRSEINIRAGYVPPEDRPVYKNRRVVGGILQYEVGESASTEGTSTNSSSVQSPVATETEQDNAEGNGPLRNAKIVYTTEWYSNLKKNREGWEHIYVGPWDECFKILKIRSMV